MNLDISVSKILLPQIHKGRTNKPHSTTADQNESAKQVSECFLQNNNEEGNNNGQYKRRVMRRKIQGAFYTKMCLEYRLQRKLMK